MITLNSVTGNTGRGLYCVATAPAKILYNDVNGNTGNGLDLTAGNGSVVNYNNLYNNNASGYELNNGNGSSVNAQFNYWGTTATSQMDGGDNPKDIGVIYDLFDLAGRGAADYANWLGGVLSLPGTLASEITFPVHGAVFSAASVTHPRPGSIKKRQWTA